MVIREIYKRYYERRIRVYPRGLLWLSSFIFLPTCKTLKRKEKNMRRYILFTEEELMEMVRGGEISHKISGTDETLYFMCKDYFLIDEEENNETNFDETANNSESFVFETEHAARFAISSLKRICDWYGLATLADWYDICGCDKTNYLMNKEGWLETHLKDVKLEKVRDGYKVKLPQTFYIE